MMSETTNGMIGGTANGMIGGTTNSMTGGTANGMMNGINEREALLFNVRASEKIMSRFSEAESNLIAATAEFEKKRKVRKTKKFLVKAATIYVAVCGALVILFVIVSQGIFEGIRAGIVIAIMLLAIKKFKKIKNDNLEKLERNKEYAEQEYMRIVEDPTISWVPLQYRYPIALESISQYVLTGRADTLKEALNLFERECHEARLEGAAAALQGDSATIKRLSTANLVLSFLRFFK